ncbi:MAG: hypothetical protein IJ759_06845 [Bacteroidales bacterium]|nr:hypothetical protein [Bacteroidales bacterium]
MKKNSDIERPYYVVTNGDGIYPPFEHVNSSYFMLTMDGSANIECAYLQNVTITDFDYDKEEDMIYFCGVLNWNYTTYYNIVGWINLATLFNISTNVVNLYQINPPASTSYLKKIDFYRTYETKEKKLSLIANDNDNTIAYHAVALYTHPRSQFITFDISSNSYHILEISGYRLTDVIHTETRVAVVGILDKTHLVLFSHDQQNVDNYIGQIFETYILYDYAEDITYSIAPLKEDKIVVGSSLVADEGHGRLEFTMFDISFGINLIHTQAIVNSDNYLEGRSKIIDMEFDKETGILHILALNGCNYIYLKDMILQIRPFETIVYPAYVIVPDKTVTGYNLMKSFTLYRNNQYYLVFGAMANNHLSSGGLGGNLYFFDKIAYVYTLNESHCEENYYFDMELIHSKYIPSSIDYNMRIDSSAAMHIYTILHTNKVYQVICND